MTMLRVWRAGERDRGEAYALVMEYYEAVGVLKRDSEESFLEEYFAPGCGCWLASIDGVLAGCIALRRLPDKPRAGEIKRMYVRPAFRGQRVALALLVALEQFAAANGDQWLYLDSKDDLTTALRFYERHGYQPCERYNDNPQATVFLRKAVSAEDNTSAARSDLQS